MEELRISQKQVADLSSRMQKAFQDATVAFTALGSAMVYAANVLRLNSIQQMGHMKTWWIFGLKPWGFMRPAEMTTAKGTRYVPLILGLWIRWSK